jgi:hypothetical protein
MGTEHAYHEWAYMSRVFGAICIGKSSIEVVFGRKGTYFNIVTSSST